ncbi:MAG: tetratricopeptide repeat protein [Flavobacterium sp.]
MKKLLYLLLLVTVSTAAQDAGNLYTEANKLYQSGKYNEAATLYEGILKSRHESAELYYNLGNAYYKQNKIAPAIYNYEKALILDPDNADVQNNLNFAEQKRIDKITPLPKPGLSGLVESWAGGYHYDSWAWGAVVFAFLSLITFAGYYLLKKEKHKRIFFAGLCLSVLLFVVSIASSAFLYRAASEDNPGIVFTKSLAVKTDPDNDAADAFRLHEGTKVQVEDLGGDWAKIRLQDNREGWVSSGAIRMLR